MRTNSTLSITSYAIRRILRTLATLKQQFADDPDSVIDLVVYQAASAASEPC
jgi:hypothetical protein